VGIEARRVDGVRNAEVVAVEDEELRAGGMPESRGEDSGFAWAWRIDAAERRSSDDRRPAAPCSSPARGVVQQRYLAAGLTAIIARHAEDVLSGQSTPPPHHCPGYSIVSAPARH